MSRSSLRNGLRDTALSGYRGDAARAKEGKTCDDVLNKTQANNDDDIFSTPHQIGVKLGQLRQAFFHCHALY